MYCRSRFEVTRAGLYRGGAQGADSGARKEGPPAEGEVTAKPASLLPLGFDEASQALISGNSKPSKKQSKPKKHEVHDVALTIMHSLESFTQTT